MFRDFIKAFVIVVVITVAITWPLVKCAEWQADANTAATVDAEAILNHQPLSRMREMVEWRRSPFYRSALARALYEQQNIQFVKKRLSPLGSATKVVSPEVMRYMFKYFGIAMAIVQALVEAEAQYTASGSLNLPGIKTYLGKQHVEIDLSLKNI